VIIEKRRFIRKLNPINIKSKALGYWYGTNSGSGWKTGNQIFDLNKGYYASTYPELNNLDDDIKCEINPPIFVYSMALVFGFSVYLLVRYVFVG